MPVTKVKVNGEWIPAMPVGGGGEGDMTKAVYDTNDDGVVNAADQATKDGSGNVITTTYAAKATTLSGYGITDAKIQNGSIILGSNSITPLTSFTETDPTVPAWAKAASKPTYTATEVGAISTSAKGAASGVAELDANGLVPTSQLPSYVDDVLEYNSKSSFPSTGETGKIYVDTSTNLTYRWGGSDYVEISPSLALGTTSSTAFRGDYGQSAYTHAVTNKGSAFTSGLYKITTNSEGHVTAAVAVTASDIPGLSSKADSATTLAGYGITDASISNRTITLGSNTITVPENMVILSYGNSTWNDFISAYNTNRVVYCRASSNSNPATGSQTRLAFMAYVNNATTPTEVEFQYYRSVSSHSASQQGDQVYVYKINSSGTWSVTTREAYSKIAVTSPISSSYSSGTITLSLADAYGDTQNPYGTKTANYILAGPTSGSAAAPSFRALVADDIPSLTASKISDISLSNGTITIGSNSITPVTSSALADYIASDEIGKVYVSDTEPSNTSNYDIWIDTSTTLQNANGVMV